MASTRRSKDRELRNELRAAIGRGELVPHYQPIVDLRSGAVTRLEALARWPHSAHGWVEPDDFVPVAERNGLVLPLWNLMLERGLADLPAWRSRVPWLRVGLNVSALGLARPNFADEFLKGIEQAGASPDWVSLEITESLLVRDADMCTAHISRLRGAGMRIDIDDFGSGFSSLRHLRLMRLDALKIDRQFVVAAREEPASGTIVRAIIHLCHDLGMEAVAEGVESRDTLDTLTALGCDSAQGYYIGRPMPASEVGAWLEAWPSRAARLGFTLGDPRTGPRDHGGVEDELEIAELAQELRGSVSDLLEAASRFGSSNDRRRH